MRGASSRDVATAYLANVRLALGCLGSFDVRGDRFVQAGVPHTLYVNHLRPIPLRSTEFGVVAFRVRQGYSFREDRTVPRASRWELTLLEYSYALIPVGDEEDSKELMAFHWHPVTQRTEPHIHVYSTICTHPAVMNSHIPSGQIPLEDVIAYLLDDWRIASPLSERVWRSCLAQTRLASVDGAKLRVTAPQHRAGPGASLSAWRVC